MADKEELWIDRLFKQNYVNMCKSAYVLLKDYGLAEQITQDVFTVLSEKQEQVKRHKNQRAWLYKTLYNRIHSELQKSCYTREIQLGPEIELLAAEDGEEFHLDDVLPAELDPKYRQLLIWYYEDGLSHQQIAERINRTDHASETRLYRAKNRLRELLAKK